MEASAQFDRIELPPSKQDKKVVRGRDGWLFLDSDSNRVMAQHSGELRLSDRELDQWQFVLETRAAWLEKLDARYFVLVAPDAHSVYPEKLPEHVKPAEERPIHQVMNHLREQASYARIIYPLDDLVAQKRKFVYPMTGSHWSELGAFLGYRRLMEEIRAQVQVTVPVLELDDFELVEQQAPGDLGRKVDPVEDSSFVWLDMRRPPRARLIADNRIASTGRRVEFEGPDDSELTCLVIGDSYSVRLVHFVAESFKRLVFAHTHSLDYELVRAERPDIVVTVMGERFMIRVPVDVVFPTTQESEERKRASGLVLRPRRVETNRLNASR